MNRHEFLRRLHEVYRPRTYLEIGVFDGRSLTLSRVPTVAIDPAYKITAELHCDLHLAKATSDDFFARPDPLAHLKGARIDLAFIDGMHLLEYALRDFINVEKHATPGSVAVFDDQLPRNVDEAARDRHTGAWTGDVYKIVPVLQRYRPDLMLALMDTQPTGVMAVIGLDPTSTTLAEHFDEIVRDFLVKDPQQVPETLLSRSCAMTPEALFAGAFWPSLVAARDAGDPQARAAALAEIGKELSQHPQPALGDWLPDPTLGHDDEKDASVCIGESAMLQEVRRRAQPPPPAPAASASKTRPKSRPSGLRRLARRAPFLRRLPGARTLARWLP